MQSRLLAGTIAVAAVLGGLVASSANGSDSDVAKRGGGRTQTLSTGLSIPWGMDFLPNGSALVTERGSGVIYKVRARGGNPKPLMTVAGVDSGGEGGLLGLALSPRYRRDRLVYVYYTAAGDNRVARFKLGEQPEVILQNIPKAGIHNGGRIEFGPDRKLYIGTGDAGDSSNAQSLETFAGKILRINQNGSTPNDNPFGDSKIWSYGHRNVQGFDWDADGRMWASELGQNTLDELNLIRPGRNYGWPVREGDMGEDGDFVDPKVTWATSEASPSGVAIKNSTVFMAALRGERLWRIPINGVRAGNPKAIFNGTFGRLRTVELAPDRSLWLATANGSNSDRIIRVGRR